MLTPLAEASIPLDPTAHHWGNRTPEAHAAAEQIARLVPPEVQNREALVLIRCGRDTRELLARVFSHSSGDFLVVPATGRRASYPWFLPMDPSYDEVNAEMPVRVQGRCCAADHTISTAEIRDAVRRRTEMDSRAPVTLRAIG